MIQRKKITLAHKLTCFPKQLHDLQKWRKSKINAIVFVLVFRTTFSHTLLHLGLNDLGQYASMSMCVLTLFLVLSTVSTQFKHTNKTFHGITKYKHVLVCKLLFFFGT